jgi:hypothetical protein
MPAIASQPVAVAGHAGPRHAAHPTNTQAADAMTTDEH